MEDLPDQARGRDSASLQGEVQRAGEWEQETAGGHGGASEHLRAVVLTTPLPRWLAVLLTLLLTVAAAVIGYLAGMAMLLLVFAALLYRFVRKLMRGPGNGHPGGIRK